MDDGKFFHVGKNCISPILPITSGSDPALSPITTTFHVVTPCYCDGKDVSDGAAIQPSENAIVDVNPSQNCVTIKNEFKNAIGGRRWQLSFSKWPDPMDVTRWKLESNGVYLAKFQLRQWEPGAFKPISRIAEIDRGLTVEKLRLFLDSNAVDNGRRYTVVINNAKCEHAVIKHVIGDVKCKVPKDNLFVSQVGRLIGVT